MIFNAGGVIRPRPSTAHDPLLPSPDHFTSPISHTTRPTMRRTSRILCRRQRYRLSRDYAADFAR
ncbi:MAG: hypothetical protein K2F99_05700, partial [Muribaculaceae bacterium]|nr:hypothetical protein [Muribaculaceae bacterium]